MVGIFGQTARGLVWVGNAPTAEAAANVVNSNASHYEAEYYFVILLPVLGVADYDGGDNVCELVE